MDMNLTNAEKYAAKARKGKVGRRGDPRMHLAVNARLAIPQMTLLDALLEGGFSFPNLGVPHLSDRAIKDKDDVSLCQRKNQLMRRLRTATPSQSMKKSSGKNPSYASTKVEEDVSKKSNFKKPKGEADTTSGSNKPKKIESRALTSKPTANEVNVRDSSSYQHIIDTPHSLLASMAQQSQDASAYHQLPTTSNTGIASIPAYLQAFQHSWMPSGTSASDMQQVKLASSMPTLHSQRVFGNDMLLGTRQMPELIPSSVEQAATSTHQARQMVPLSITLFPGYADHHRSTNMIGQSKASATLDFGSVPTAEELIGTFGTDSIQPMSTISFRNAASHVAGTGHDREGSSTQLMMDHHQQSKNFYEIMMQKAANGNNI